MGVHTFLKGIFMKMNVIVLLEFELAYYDSTVHHFNHYTTRIPQFINWIHLHCFHLFSPNASFKADFIFSYYSSVIALGLD